MRRALSTVFNDRIGFYLIVGIFTASWIIPTAIYRIRGCDRMNAEVG
jgi:hypothetical protein